MDATIIYIPILIKLCVQHRARKYTFHAPNNSNQDNGENKFSKVISRVDKTTCFTYNDNMYQLL